VNSRLVCLAIIVLTTILSGCGGGGPSSSPPPPSPPPPSPPPPPPVITITTPSPLPGGVAGVPYSLTFTAQGGTVPLSWDVATGNVAPGFMLSPDGILTGTSPAYFGGWNSQFTVRVTDSAVTPNTASKSFTLDLFGFQPTSIPVPQVGVDYSQDANFGAVGGTEPITWQLSGALPNGLAFVKDSDRQTDILGTPTTIGHYQFSITATDSSLPIRSETVSFALDVEPPVLRLPHILLPPGVVSKAYDFTFPHSGGAAPYAWTFTPISPLPLGMQFDSVNGKLTGTPTAPGYALFALFLSDSSSPTLQQTQQGYWLLVTPNALPLRNDTIANATPIYYPGDYSASISPYNDPPGTTSPDQDYYQLTAPAGTMLSIGVGASDNFCPLSSSTLEPVIEIVDANGHRFSTCNDPFDDNPAPGIPIATDTNPNGFDDPCMNASFQARLNFRVPGSSGNVTFYLHVFDFRGEARPDMFYTFGIHEAN
jgi:hypothetical protein